MKLNVLSVLGALIFSSCTLSNSNVANKDNYTDSLYCTNLFDSSMAHGVTCYRIPSIVTSKNGNLIAAIDERVPSGDDLNNNKDINIVVRRSQDNGKTWSRIERVVDFPYGESASDPSMIVDELTGEIFLFYNYMDLNKEPNIYYFHVVSSKDNGKTWSKPKDLTPFITTEDMKKDFKFITSGRGVYTSSGKLLHTIVNGQKGLTVFGSNDHGKTWYSIKNFIKPADESKIIDLPNGNWMINSRVNRFGYRYVHTSLDEGKTWTSRVDSTLIDPGCNGSIVKYSSIADGSDKDRVIISNAADKKRRKNLTVRISYDNGKTWSHSRTIYEGGAAYSSLTVLKNGDIAVFYEKDDYKSNEVVIFSLEWLTKGEDKKNN